MFRNPSRSRGEKIRFRRTTIATAWLFSRCALSSEFTLCQSLTEDVFFRIPKCLFEPSPGKFEPLLLDKEERDVTSLPDLTADEFRALIDFFLP